MKDLVGVRGFEPPAPATRKHLVDCKCLLISKIREGARGLKCLTGHNRKELGAANLWQGASGSMLVASDMKYRGLASLVGKGSVIR